jgi:hypothetical protein
MMRTLLVIMNRLSKRSVSKMHRTPKFTVPSTSALYRCKFVAVKIVSRFGKHALDVGNQAIKAAISCERVISLLDHLRENHKDVSALIRL